MKTLLVAAVLALVVPSVVLACEGEEHAAAGETSGKGKPTFTLAEATGQKAVFKVKGMSCRSCEKAIQASLKKIQGVKEVAFRKGKDSEGVRVAEVTLAEGAQVTQAMLVQAVEDAGYHASAQ